LEFATQIILGRLAASPMIDALLRLKRLLLLKRKNRSRTFAKTVRIDHPKRLCCCRRRRLFQVVVLSQARKKRTQNGFEDGLRKSVKNDDSK
tara:strand:+ start:393 stop:668 length:276 start_codon:yes stop_codon:yes gene_type:complete